MKKIIIAFFAALLLAATPAIADEFPLKIAGFTLGEPVDQYYSFCDMDRASSIPDAPFLNEVHLESDSIPGIRGGSLTYANCDKVGTLMRVKLKFHDRSQRFFDALYREYEDKFGDPDSYEGDSFRNIVAWKWNFKRGDERLSILLMWSKKKQMRPGVSIKMTLDSIMDSEYACYKKKHDDEQERRGGKTSIENIEDFVAH